MGILMACSKQVDEERLLHSVTQRIGQQRKSDIRLGEVIETFLRERSRMLEQGAAVSDVWKEVIPPSLQPFCRPDKIAGHTLYIQVQPGAPMYQMQLLTSHLLEQIRQQLPGSRIRTIRLVPLAV